DDMNIEKCLEKGRQVTCCVLSLVIDDKTKQGAVVADPVEPEKVFFVAEEQGADLMLVLITRYYCSLRPLYNEYDCSKGLVRSTGFRSMKHFREVDVSVSGVSVSLATARYTWLLVALDMSQRVKVNSQEWRSFVEYE
ncbi:hypothetical protein Tco_0145302, partial [Tanacetum coccineum]